MTLSWPEWVFVGTVVASIVLVTAVFYFTRNRH